jgi:Flp pilus assembly protein TadD
MMARFPDRVDARFYRATALFQRGRSQDAVEAARQVVDAHPEHTRAQSLLGAACAAVGRRDCALAAFGAAIRGNPRDASGYVNAGLLSLQLGNIPAARDYFASALTLDPSSKPARDGSRRRVLKVLKADSNTSPSSSRASPVPICVAGSERRRARTLRASGM